MAHEAGKGSRPRPFSVSQETFSNNWNNIFGRKTMAPSVNQMKQGTCGCGRSPTGDCIGWHGLTEETYKKKLLEWQEKNVNKNVA